MANTTDTVAIIVSTEWLGPSYGLSNETWLGVNLSVGILEATPPMPLPNDLLLRVLSPWDWTIDVTDWHIAGTPDPANNKISANVTTVSPDLSDFQQFKKIYVDKLLSELKESIGGKKYVWDPTGKADRDRVISPEAGPYWHQRIGHIATSPSPVPQLLNLAFILHFKSGTLTNTGFVVAPVIKIAGTKLEPTDFEQDAQGNFRCAFKVDGDLFPAAAITQPASKPTSKRLLYQQNAAPPQKPGAKSRQVTSAVPSSPLDVPVDSADDWIAHLADRAATGFDLASVLLDVLEDPSIDAKSKAIRDVLKPDVILDALLALLADVFVASEFPAPNGRSVTELAREGWRAIDTKTDPIPTKLVLPSDRWTEILSQVLARGSGSTASKTIKGLTGSLPEILPLLHRLRSGGINDNNVPELLLATWSVGKGARPESGAFESFCRQQFFPKLQLSRRLRLGLVGKFWPALTHFQDHTLTDHVNARKNFVSAFLGKSNSYVEARFSSGSDFSPDLSDPKYAGIKAILQGERAIARAQQYALNVLVPQPTVLGAGKKQYVSPTRVPHPLIISVDRAAGVDQSLQSDDPLQHSRGVAVFLRKKDKGDGNWRPLNFAIPMVYDSKSHMAQCGSAVLAPSRLCYANGVKAGTVIYNAAPLAAKGPLAYLADQAMSSKDTTTGVGVLDPIVQYTYLGSQAGAPPTSLLSGKMPALVFGETYQAFAAIISNTGALPEALVDTSAAKTDPTKLDPTRLRATQPTKIDDIFLTGDIEYKRRVPVGGVRIVKPSTTTELAEFPDIPAGVSPLCRDFSVSGIDANADPTHPIPVLLLAESDFSLPGRQTFDFDILAPVVDVNTWDRSISEADSLSKIRSAVWQQYFNRARMGRAVALELVDPAVESIVCVCGKITFTLPIDSTNFQTTQRLSIHVTTLDAAQEPTQYANRIQLVRGTPTQLDVFVVLKEDHLKNFDNIEAVAEARTAERRVRSFTVLMECATRRLPEPDALWHQLSVQRLGDVPAKWEVRLPLKPKDLDFTNIGTVEIQRQAWRWRGRPVAEYNFSNLASDEATADADPDKQDVSLPLRFWEAEEFGGRTDDDHLLIPAKRAVTSDGGQTVPWASYTEDLVNDPRAAYMRFGVRITSRYDGLRPPGASPIQVSTLTNIDSLKRWRRTFVPCRLTAISGVPKVTMVLPLTEPALPKPWHGTKPHDLVAAANSHQPGLLAILSEPWFAVAGLAEDLKVEVQSVPPLTQDAVSATLAGGTTATADREVILEMGPDPILTLSACAVTPGKNKVWAEKNGPPLVGPVGHTFDNSFEDPLFVSSSFIIRPPDVCGTERDGKPGDTFEWFFVKLRFQRAVRTDRCDPALQGARGLEGKAKRVSNGGNAGPLDSEFTHAHWVQYIPGFSIWETTSHQLADIADYAVAVLDGVTFQLVSRRDKSPFVAPAVGAFATFAVVTTSIVDASGDPDQEAFVGVFGLTGSMWKLISGNTATPPLGIFGDSLLVRLVEIQIPDASWLSKIGTQSDFWNGLFGGTNSHTDDAKARIVRISKAVGTKSPVPRVRLALRNGARE
jgi:hypothetical protein